MSPVATKKTVAALDQEFATYRSEVRKELGELKDKMTRLETKNETVEWFLKKTVVAWITALTGGAITVTIILLT